MCYYLLAALDLILYLSISFVLEGVGMRKEQDPESRDGEENSLEDEEERTLLFKWKLTASFFQLKFKIVLFVNIVGTTFTAIVNFISCLQFIVTLSISANSHSDLKSNHSIIMSKLLFLGRLYYHYASQSRLGDQSRHDVSNPGFGLGRHNCLLPNAEPLHLPVPLADMVATLITAKIVFKVECFGSFNCRNSRLLFCAGATNFLLSLEQQEPKTVQRRRFQWQSNFF